jgi:hypothetical protein
LLIIAFFLFFGCPYEFIKCYLEKKVDDDDSIEYNDIEEGKQENKDNNEDESCTCGKITVCIILGIVGFALQPLYLLFYILYGMMECYRRWGCLMFYA